MGKRKSKRKPPPKQKRIGALSLVFPCPFCSHDRSCEVKMYENSKFLLIKLFFFLVIEKQMLVQLNVVCVKKHIQQLFIVKLLFLYSLMIFYIFVDLSEPIDVYNSWIDACEEQNRD